jgi:hypothetical protein
MKWRRTVAVEKCVARSERVDVGGGPASRDPDGDQEEGDFEEAAKEGVDPALADAEASDRDRIEDADGDVQPSVQFRWCHGRGDDDHAGDSESESPA